MQISYPKAAIAISRQVALIFSKDSSQAAKSKDGVSLNYRTVPEEHTGRPTVSFDTQKTSANISD